MIVKFIYKTLRSILFTVTLLIVGLFVLTYTLISIPSFTNFVKDQALLQISNYLETEVSISSLDIYPFNEAKITGLEVLDREGNRCLYVETVGAGISLWKLLTQGKIDLSFGEIIGLDARIVQYREGEPLNIDFIIKAFSKKDENKEPSPFSLALRNVVLRKSSASFSRPWAPPHNIGSLNLNDIRIHDLAADISFPKISDQGIEVDLRRLSLAVDSAVRIQKIGFVGEFSKTKISLDNFTLQFPASRIHIPSVVLVTDEGENFAEALKTREFDLDIRHSYLTPSDFEFLDSRLGTFSEQLDLQTELTGNLTQITVNRFSFGNPSLFSLSFKGGVEGLDETSAVKGDVSDLSLTVEEEMIGKLLPLLPSLPPELSHALKACGAVGFSGEFAGAMSNHSLKGEFELVSDCFDITFEGGVEKSSDSVYSGNGELTIENLKLNSLLPSVPFDNINANIVADLVWSSGLPEGMASVVVDDFDFKGVHYDGLSFNVSKEGPIIDGDIFANNAIVELEARFNGDLESEEKNVSLDMDLNSLNLSELIDMKAYNNYIIAGNLNIDGKGTDINDLTGELVLNDFSFRSDSNPKNLRLNRLKLMASAADSLRTITLDSDWINLRAEGFFKLNKLPAELYSMAQTVFPLFLNKDYGPADEFRSDIDFDILIKKNNTLPEFFNLPVRLLVPVTLSGSIEGSSGAASFSLDIPYLQQGKDKLIYDTKVVADIDAVRGLLNGFLQTNVPVKKGDLSLNVNFFGSKNSVSTDLHWINTENSDFKGHLVLDTFLGRNDLTLSPEINLQIKPSVLQMGTAEWNLSPCNISYSDKYLNIDGLKLWHDRQLVEVKGTASPEFSDVVNITLADIDVDYIFDMLQINFVTFGGTATGEISGHALLSGNPVAQTESLMIRSLTYNGCLIGDCLTASRWNNEEKEIEISADISHDGHRRVLGNGGIWLGRDSLSFDLKADKVPVDFVQPFMEVFSSHVGGYATGDVKLFGTFHDIDMTGKIFADSVAVKLDYTNTIYHGSDSVYLYPGRIEIPHFRLYDKFENSAMLTGELTHNFFHDPSFTFRLSDASNFLCYDTTSEINPDWYGVLFGSGSALVKGVPGLVDISADMTVSGNSAFTFVLNDTQYARDYQFLTFSDRRKELNTPPKELTTEDIKEMLKKSMVSDQGSLSRFGIDIRATVTPQVLFTLVMDPAAGDKITARGKGALQVKYESDDDEMMMYGKYEIEEGNYNFSLQDIILRDFKIKEGSYITFNGNPLAADMDISATYRVNTNLSDLDKSFSTDRDLNRTNVPVDAVLSVNGNMTSPDITFDIELPTLTQDVERKVKSIISTDDMMNRQIIYLLALNRFYTPEYMGASGNGGELAAVASSTISSQLSNILGQLTDKFSIAPSFRSDKGDFSDIEVDVALSSRLLNNRLLINGNFGYRDRSTSSTTFVGDFDVEYLLSKNGNLRLKAYNHFNDQNYYLREALTTQGLGVVYRKDFDNWFTFLKKRGKKSETDSEKSEEGEETPDAEEDSQATITQEDGIHD